MACTRNISESFGCPHRISNEVLRLGEGSTLLMPKGIYRLDCKASEPSEFISAFSDKIKNGHAAALLDAAKYGAVKSLDHVVYVVATESRGASKIGYTADPLRRMANLQNSNYEKLEYSHLFWIPEKVALGVEKFALRLAKKMDKLIHGEWVDMSPDEAAFLVGTVIAESGAACSNSAMFIANHKMVVDAYRAHDEEWPSNAYRKTDWAQFKQFSIKN